MPRCHASIVIRSRAVALFWGKIAVHFALFSDKFTQLARILHDRRSHRSRQISTLVEDSSGIPNEQTSLSGQPDLSETFPSLCIISAEDDEDDKKEFYGYEDSVFSET